jgi:NitT/TauT family transport system substrate-binding protein
VAQVPLYAAIENGYLEDEALSAEITALQGSGGQAMAALVSGSVDVLSAGSTTFANAIGTEAVDAKIFYQFAAATADVVGREGLTSIDDLPEGATIGITGPGSQDQAWFQYAVEQRGLDPSSFTYVGAGATGERLAGLQTGAYDAIAVAAQFREQYGSGVILIDGVEEGLSFPAVMLGAMTEDIEDNSDVLVRLVRAMGRGADWARDPANRDGAVEMCVKYTQADPDVCGASLDGFVREDPQFTISSTGQVDEVGIRDTLAIFAEISPDLAGLTYEMLVDSSIVELAAG